MKDISAADLENNIPLVARRHEGHATTVRVGPAEFGGAGIVVIAGPCAVENEELMLDIARAVKRAGAHMLRGGAFKPLTFPYRRGSMMELGEPGLALLQQAGKETGLPVVTEVMDVRAVEAVAEHADMLQIGARNMSNFPLLIEVAKAGKPILLKRHFGASLRDWLGAAEYLYYHGNTQVVLCERGVVAPHTHEVTSRFIVDLQVVPAVREYLPPAGDCRPEPLHLQTQVRRTHRPRRHRRRRRRHHHRRSSRTREGGRQIPCRRWTTRPSAR